MVDETINIEDNTLAPSNESVGRDNAEFTSNVEARENCTQMQTAALTLGDVDEMSDEEVIKNYPSYFCKLLERVIGRKLTLGESIAFTLKASGGYDAERFRVDKARKTIIALNSTNDEIIKTSNGIREFGIWSCITTDEMLNLCNTSNVLELKNIIESMNIKHTETKYLTDTNVMPKTSFSKNATDEVTADTTTTKAQPLKVAKPNTPPPPNNEISKSSNVGFA